MISFVIPAHNEEATLPATLSAIAAAADALGRPWEAIVVDDASTDATAGVARAAGARVVSVSLRHIAAVRNAGARAARGSLLIFVDADTLVSSEVVRFAAEAVGSGAVGGGARVRLDPRTPRWARAAVWTFSQAYFGLGLAAGCFVFARRDAFEAAGGFDERFYASEEVHISRALRRFGRFVVSRTPVTTSGRKFRLMSPAAFAWRTAVLIATAPVACRRRERLDLWYGEGWREPEA